MNVNQWSVGQYAALACLLEATAAKPGNVYRGADFADVAFPEFLVSAVAIAPQLDAAVSRGLGQAVLAAVADTRRAAGSNTNLGIVLLLTPLAMVGTGETWQAGVRRVLGELSLQDAEEVYAAIRLAEPGGLGGSAQQDVSQAPTVALVEAMRLAEERDRVARQYSRNFEDVLDCALPWLVEMTTAGYSLHQSIVHVHVRLMSAFPDTLMARKCGAATANKSALMAHKVLDAGPPESEPYQRQLAELDFWLRSDGHRRNPGTTADLVTAALFAALRDGSVGPPYRLYAGGRSDSNRPVEF